jgi:hypothetical protein
VKGSPEDRDDADLIPQDTVIPADR